MKCIYCGQECKEPGYGDEMNHEYCIDLSNGVETVVYIHDKCLPRILGQWVRNKVHPILYGAPYDFTPKVTCDTIPLSADEKISDYCKKMLNYTTQYSGNDCCMNCERVSHGPIGLYCDAINAKVFKGDTCNGFKRAKVIK